MKAFFPALLISISAISCSPVGDTISEEKPLDKQLVNTTENIDLKEGDVLVIWGKIDAGFLENDKVPVFQLHYNLSLDGKTVENQTIPMFSDKEHLINSSYEIQKEEEDENDQSEEQNSTELTENTEETSGSPEETPEQIVKSDWIFEQEIIKIPIKKDGKYTLDYKAGSSDEKAESLFTKVSVILRKK